MPTNTNQGFTIPAQGDDPNIPDDISTFALTVEKRVVAIFDNAAARDAYFTSPVEGQFAFLKDTNRLTFYTGSAWQNLDNTDRVITVSTSGPSGGANGDIWFRV